MNLKINPAFQSLLPRLSDDEISLLRSSIERDGCRDPLVVWRGVIVDGHNRYAICRDLGVSFDFREMDFPDDASAMDWIDQNQLGRRNLTPDAFKLALGRRYNRMKKTRGGNTSKGQNVSLSLAQEHGVSDKTVKRAGKFAEEVEATPAFQRAIHEGVPVRSLKKAVRQEIQGMATQAHHEMKEATKHWSPEMKALLTPEMCRQRGELKRLVSDIIKLPDAAGYRKRHGSEWEADFLVNVKKAIAWLKLFLIADNGGNNESS
tara:strand:- start:13450 stop:14235 length:786 start_codon:yes stop_codon:yes gene_type:complete